MLYKQKNIIYNILYIMDYKKKYLKYKLKYLNVIKGKNLNKSDNLNKLVGGSINFNIFFDKQIELLKNLIIDKPSLPQILIILDININMFKYFTNNKIDEYENLKNINEELKNISEVLNNIHNNIIIILRKLEKDQTIQVQLTKLQENITVIQKNITVIQDKINIQKFVKNNNYMVILIGSYLLHIIYIYICFLLAICKMAKNTNNVL